MPTLWISKKNPDDVLHPIPIVAPWYHVGIDLVKMTKSKNGNSYILSLVDYFTKWPDQGREFANSVMSSLIEKTNAVHRISTAYHPQTNGLNQNDWDIFLPEL